MSKRELPQTGPFFYNREKQVVIVEDGIQTIRRRKWNTRDIVDEVICPYTRCGCAIDEIEASPSGAWLVTRRNSGQGEWGYDVFQTAPLARVAGIPDEKGYMLDAPTFAEDESQIVGGFGQNWLGGWWAHPDDDFETPARGGKISFGFLLVHHLPSHRVERHEFKINLPKDWFPDNFESEIWHGAAKITPGADKVSMELYGGVKFEIIGPPPPVIQLPVPHPAGKRLL